MPYIQTYKRMYMLAAKNMIIKATRSEGALVKYATSEIRTPVEGTQTYALAHTHKHIVQRSGGGNHQSTTVLQKYTNTYT